MSKTTVYLIRHGQSLGNLNRIFLGHTDLGLSELGIQQAKATSEVLSNVKIDKIYSSDLKRAYETAVSVAKPHNLGVITDKNLREVFAGEWENKNVDQLIEIWGREVFVNQWKERFGEFTFPSGESVKDAGKRFYNEIASICNKNPGKTIVVTAHAAVIRSFWSIITNTPWNLVSERVPFATNASYSICSFDNEIFTPISYSNDDYLNGVGITEVNLI